MKLVGMVGPMGSGKDYLANMYLTPLGYENWSLALHFKIWLVAQGKASYEDVFFHKPPEVRKLLQEEGTERGRWVYGEDIWINTALLWLRWQEENHGRSRFVFTDLRFPNEIEAFRRAGATLLYVRAPDRVEERLAQCHADAKAHPSESSIPTASFLYDWIIDNRVEPEVPIDEQMAHIITRLGLAQ